MQDLANLDLQVLVYKCVLAKGADGGLHASLGDEAP
jgi:hypothetical protein